MRPLPTSVLLLLVPAALPGAEAVRHGAESADALAGSAEEGLHLGRAGAIAAASAAARHRDKQRIPRPWTNPNAWKANRCSADICEAIAECVAVGFSNPERPTYDPRNIDHVTQGGRNCRDLHKTQNLCVWSWSFSLFGRRCGCHSRQFYATHEHEFGDAQEGFDYKGFVDAQPGFFYKACPAECDGMKRGTCKEHIGAEKKWDDQCTKRPDSGDRVSCFVLANQRASQS